MSIELDPKFVTRYERYYGPVKALGVPIEIWRDVLIEMYSPIDDWDELPKPFRNLNGDLEPGTESRQYYNLDRSAGLTDRDYAIGLLKWSEQVIESRSEFAAGNLDKLLKPGENYDPEWLKSVQDEVGEGEKPN
jgi:hypothetical protein